MPLTFRTIPSRSGHPRGLINVAILQTDNWDDYSYKTLFHLSFYDQAGQLRDIGSVKIGYLNQPHGRTSDLIPEHFEQLPTNFFSLGQDANYYKQLMKIESAEDRSLILNGLRDIVFMPDILDEARKQDVYATSLLRSVSRNAIDQQFKRVLKNQAELTPYFFNYEKKPNERFSGISLTFRVTPDIKPPSNVHVLIGRNGVGKTTMLNNMVDCLVGKTTDPFAGSFTLKSDFGPAIPFPPDYFTGVLSVSFSAFDPFEPPPDQNEEIIGMLYSYIGLKVKNEHNQWILKSKHDLCEDFTKSLSLCFALSEKRNRWLEALGKLESDDNFAEMELGRLVDLHHADSSENRNRFRKTAYSLFDRMSSGHAIVLLTITKLIEKVEEKTLILIDEPEVHLHPPLLSAFTRALSDLLSNRNGVAIIATHSPVVLQEVPKSCVSIISRTRLVAKVEQPRIETFGENVGMLTREVFGLEVNKSGFYNLLEDAVASGKTYEQIVTDFNDQIGYEGKAILQSLISIRNLTLE